MKKRLEQVLKEKLPVCSSNSFSGAYDIVGDIAVLRVPENAREKGAVIAEIIRQEHKNIKTILLQVGEVAGEFRLRPLEWLLGEKKTETIHKEWGCMYKVDLANCYFSPRLSFERMRIARLVRPGETVVNMFAGVGCFSVLMAKLGRAQIVYSVDVNPIAVKYLQENARLNRVEAQLVSFQGDAKDTIARRLRDVADRVIMPLPRKAFEYLEYALMALKSRKGLIHYYDFEHAAKGENAVEKVKVKVTDKLSSLGIGFNVSFGRVVRSTGPHWHQVVLDIHAFT